MFNKTVIDAITKIAEKYGYETEALLAVVDVESAGVAFWSINGEPKPPIRFEGHYFFKRLNSEQLTVAIKEGLANKKAGAVKNPSNYADRYALLARAVKINKKAAYESTSWGLGQVMGAHWQDLGFASVEALVEFSQSLTGQIELMVKFLEKHNLRGPINAHNWKKVANVYNGTGHKAYDVKIGKAYDKYKSGGVAGAEDADILQLQKMLNKINPDYDLDLDGIMGKETKAALKDFQLKNGLRADGIYGPLSREEVEKDYLEIVNKGNQNGGIGVGTVGGIGAVLTEVANQIEGLTGISKIAQIIFLVLIVAGLGFTIWNMLRPKKVA